MRQLLHLKKIKTIDTNHDVPVSSPLLNHCRFSVILCKKGAYDIYIKGYHSFWG